MVGGDLDVQGQLEVHQLLVVADLPGQVLLSPSQGFLQLADVFQGLLYVAVPFGPRLVDVLLQGLFLKQEKQRRSDTDNTFA